MAAVCKLGFTTQLHVAPSMVLRLLIASETLTAFGLVAGATEQ